MGNDAARCCKRVYGLLLENARMGLIFMQDEAPPLFTSLVRRHGFMNISLAGGNVYKMARPKSRSNSLMTSFSGDGQKKSVYALVGQVILRVQPCVLICWQASDLVWELVDTPLYIQIEFTTLLSYEVR